MAGARRRRRGDRLRFQRGDVVWGPDPFTSGANPRPWLILNNDHHPFGDEEYMTVTVTTTPHDEAVLLEDADWAEGGMPRQSYASPWAVASPKHAALVRRQGRLEASFVRTVVDALETFLEGPIEDYSITRRGRFRNELISPIMHPPKRSVCACSTALHHK